MKPYRSKLDVRKCETIRVCLGDDKRDEENGGRAHEFTLHKGETIIRVWGTRVRYPNTDSDLCIDQIQFETNKGNVHGPFGHPVKGGNRRIKETFDWNLSAGSDHMRNISAKVGDNLNCVNCKYLPLPTSIKLSNINFLLNNKKIQ